MSQVKQTGLEPQLGGSVAPVLLTGREPGLGGNRRFDARIWSRLIDPQLVNRSQYIQSLSSAACDLYADLLVRVLPERSDLSQVMDGGAIWSGRYSPDQRAAAITSLLLIAGRLDGARRAALVAPLLARLKSDDHDLVRCEAARALGRLGESQTERALIGVMALASWRVRLAVLHALGQVGRDRGFKFLWRVWHKGESLNEVMAAMEALGVLGARRDDSHREQIYHELMRVLIRADGLVRCAAARALGLLGDGRALDALIQAAMHGRGELQCAAVQGLGLLRDARAVPPLIGVLTGSSGPARHDTVEALVQIGGPSTAPVLAVLRHPDPAVRQAAADVLGRVGATDAIEDLVELLGDAFASVRAAVVRALGSQGDRQVVEPLIGMLGDPAAEVRKEAAAMLAHLRDGRAVGSLCLALWDRSEHVSSMAADALIAIDDAAIPALVKCLRTADSRTRRLIVHVLEHAGNETARSALVEHGALSS